MFYYNKGKTMKQLLFLIITFLLIGCGTTKTDTTQPPSTNQSTPANGTPSTQQNNNTSSQKNIYTCSNTLDSENSFNDTFIQNSSSDTEWSVSKYNKLKISDIETAFNTARAKDPTVTLPMTLPPQNIWDNYSSSEKILYLVNKERCDRGLRPFEGIDPKIVNEANNYANYLKNHPEQYAAKPHEADGRTPLQRMAQDAGIIVNSNADAFPYGENIASFSVGSSGNDFPIVHEGEAKSVYGWMYQDKNEAYGHRYFLLAKGMLENSGNRNMEGLIGVGTATRQYRNGDYFWTQVIIVMDGFDPRKNWDNNLAHTIRTDLYR